MTISNELPTTSNGQLPTPEPSLIEFLVMGKCPHCDDIPYNNHGVRIVYKKGGKALWRALKKCRGITDLNEIECKSCGKTFEIPEHLWTPEELQTPKAKKVVKKKTKKELAAEAKVAAKVKAAAKARYMKMDEEALIEAGLGDPDYRRFFMEILKTGYFRLIPQADNSTNLMLGAARHTLCAKQIAKDWKAILSGANIDEYCTDQHVRENILCDSPLSSHFRDWNTEEYLRIMPELYSREIERHRKAGRTAIEEAVEDAECHVTQVLASAYRGCVVRTIGRMLKKNKRFRCKHGKPSADFLIRERNSKK